jgi:Ras GTPase-activating-like protein IQGAP2/3
MTSGAVSPQARKNLAAISKVLTQIASGQPFGDDDPVLQSLNSYVIEAIDLFSNWFTEGDPAVRVMTD